VTLDPVPVLSISRRSAWPRCSPGDQYGRVIGRVSFDRVSVLETQFSRPALVPRHCHEYPHFFHVLSGGFEVGITSRNNALCLGDTVFHEAGEVHSGRVLTEGSRGFVVELSDYPNLRPPAKTVDGYSRRTRISSLLAQIYRESRTADAAQHFAVEGLALLVIAALQREAEPSSSQPPGWMSRAKQLLQDSPGKTHTTAELSRLLSVDGKEITIAFRQYLHCTPAEYQRAQRLDAVRKYLAETDHSIGRVAAETGFCDQAYMCHEFKRAMNCTPSQYRRLMSRRCPARSGSADASQPWAKDC
jgi:AraC family transcriptional regulator